MNVQNPCSDASGENDSRHELVTCPRCNQTVSCKPTSISACWCIQEKVSRERGLDFYAVEGPLALLAGDAWAKPTFPEVLDTSIPEAYASE